MPCARVRQLARLDRSPPSSSSSLERRLERREHAGLDALAGAQLRRDAEAEAVEALGGRQRDRLRVADRGRVARVGADHVPREQRGVGDVAGQRPAWSSEEAKAIIP